jgi:hypothetical protein
MIYAIFGSDSKSITCTGKNSSKRLERKFGRTFSAPSPPTGKNPSSYTDARIITEEGLRDAVTKWPDSVTVAGMECSGSERKRGHYY